MKTQVVSAIVAVLALSVPVSARADNEQPAPVVTPKHVEVQLGGGPSFTTVDVGDTHFIMFHAHFDLGVGHEVWKAPLGSDVISVALGYVGSVDANDAELIHRHGFGVTLRKSWFYITMSGGLTLVHDFASGDILPGGHLAVQPGFRMGPVQLGFPIVEDFLLAAPVTTMSATLGFQI